MNAQPILFIAQSWASNDAACLQSGILKAMSGSTHALMVACCNPTDPAAPGDIGERIVRLRPLGAILAPAISGDPALAAMLRQAGCRFVAISPDAQGGPDLLACSNDRQGMCDAANYLIALGHRRIGFISISDESRTARERELGFLDALAEHGLDFGAELIVQSEDSVEAARDAAHLLMAVSPRPSAILCSSDRQAAGAVQAARLLGLMVPEALSVMGFGDGEVAAVLAPPLTTMRVPYVEMGFTAAIKLLDPTRAAMQPVEFFCELVPRGSTGPVGR